MLKPTNKESEGCLQGRIEASFDDLCAVFGEPNGSGDGYKVDAEWVLADDAGKVIRIYNYKDGVNYLGLEKGLIVEDITDWHVGGSNQADVVTIMKCLTENHVKTSRLE